MTYPHQMNCSHSDTGWCLDCVSKLGADLIDLEAGFDALEKWNRYFGFCRVYKCVGCWAVSNKTDEGIGGCDPELIAEGATPKDAIIAAAKFLQDPKIPAPIPCPKCGELMDLKEYRHNCRSERMRIEFMCHKCWDIYMGDDLCPECYGNLEIIEEYQYDPNVPPPELWDVKCNRCSKIFVRGNIDRESEMIFPKWKLETLDLAAIEKSLYEE